MLRENKVPQQTESYADPTPVQPKIAKMVLQNAFPGPQQASRGRVVLRLLSGCFMVLPSDGFCLILRVQTVRCVLFSLCDVVFCYEFGSEV